jgi:hypothetical protein
MKDHEKYYHCGDPETGPHLEFQCVYTLCGINIMDASLPQLDWDRPGSFMTDWWERDPRAHPVSMPPRCPECMEHPDFSFLVLGEL